MYQLCWSCDVFLHPTHKPNTNSNLGVIQLDPNVTLMQLKGNLAEYDRLY